MLLSLLVSNAFAQNAAQAQQNPLMSMAPLVLVFVIFYFLMIRPQKKKMEEEDVYAIFIPFIGTLSLNVKQYIKEIKHKNRKFYKNFIEKVEKLLKHENYTKYGNAHKKTTAIHRLVSYIIDTFDIDEDEEE